MPVVITSQTSVPQSSSISNAASSKRAASLADGGLGSGAFDFGRCATRAGFEEIQSQRVAADRVPLMIEWICRTVDAAIGRHTCRRQPSAAQSCLLVERCFFDEPVTTATSSALTQFGVERLEMTSVELVDALAAKGGLMLRSM